MALATEPGAPDPRRADDGPRRDRRGGGARPRRRPAGGAPHLGAVHQPQPRDHQQDVRSRRRALRRPARRGGRYRDGARATRATRTRSACSAASRAAACAKDHGRLDTIPGFMPNVGEELPGCVFAGRCTLAEAICHTEEPPAHLIGGTPHEPLPLPRARPDAAARGGRRARAADGSTVASTRCSASTTSARSSSSRATTCTRSSASRRRSGPARRSVSSVSRAAARRRSPAALLGLVAADLRRGRARRARARRRRWRSARATTCERCRSSSRTRTRRSTGATRCAGSSAAR